MSLSVADLRQSASVTLAGLAGPCLLAAGGLITISQLAVWPLRGGSITSALASPVYVAAMTAYLLGLWVLIIGVFALHSRQERSAGTFGLVAVSAAAIGTANMAGNVWFDTFVGPWLVRQAPDALSAVRDGTLVAGALSSYVSMALGWVIFGAACLRARVLPRFLAAVLTTAGFAAFNPLPPYSVLFGAVVLTVGAWLIRHRMVMRPTSPHQKGQER